MLWHKTIGKGQRLLLLHGWALNSRVFLDSPLLNHYQVCLLDLPGHGNSTAIKGGFDAWVDAIVPLVDEHTIVAGWSLGGLIAIGIAHKVKIKKLLLMASSPYFVASKQWQYGIDENLLNDFYNNLNNHLTTTLKQFCLIQTESKTQGQALYQLIKENPVNKAALKTGLDILKNSDLRAMLLSLSCPVSSALGRRDRLVPEQIAHWYRQNNIDCKIYNTGHLPFLDKNFTL